MLVSVITPSYNQGKFLDSTIQSVLRQEYPNLEYFIVDGGSTDGSIEIIKKYSDHLAWWVSEGDRGQADAINKGLRRASGDVVAWLNSDDLYLPGAVYEAVKYFEEFPETGMVFGNAITINQEGSPINLLSFGDWGFYDLLRYHIICQPAVFMRKNTLDKIGYLDENFHYMLDHHLWMRIASEFPVKHSSNIWAAARHHPSAKNVAQSEGFADETYRIIEWMKHEPGFSTQFQADKRRILGGANRLAGRYLLDGGMPGPALQAYFKAFYYWPSYAVKHWGRIAFAFANLLGLGNLDDWGRSRLPDLDDLQLADWPGINLSHGL